MKREDVPRKYLKLYDRALAGEASPRVAIRLHCYQCCGWVRSEAEACTGRTCPLFRFRPGAAPSPRGKRLASRQGSQTPVTARKTPPIDMNAESAVDTRGGMR